MEVKQKWSSIIKYVLSASRVSVYKLLLVPFLYCFMHFTLNAQVIRGKVVDAATGQPLPNASIFLAGTLTGTAANKTGDFELDTKGNNSNPLVISHVGYETIIIPPEYFVDYSTVPLREKVEALEEVEVSQAPGSWSRSKMLREFKKEFLGTSAFASSCKLVNEDDVYLFYNDSSRTLHARAKKPLIIQNRMLGYRITYLLESFRMSEEGTKYKGYHNFEELEPDISNLKKRIKKNREKTYIGSVMHFMRSLYNDNIHADDTIFKISTNSNGKYYTQGRFQILSEIAPKSIYNPSNIVVTVQETYSYDYKAVRYWIKQFHLKDSGGNYVTKRQILFDKDDSRWLCFREKLRIFYYPEFMSSYMVPLADCIKIFKNGYYNPDLIRWQGSMTKKRVGDLLPYDYSLD